MAVRKVYQALVYKELDTYLMVNGQKIQVLFRGGSLQPRRNGIYSTDDPDVIRAMDQSKSNGVSYTCISITGEPEPEPVKPEETKVAKKAKPKAEKKVEPKAETKEDKLKEVPDVQTLQEAKNWLAKNVEGITLSKLMNGLAVKKMAAQNNIHFPNLK